MERALLLMHRGGSPQFNLALEEALLDYASEHEAWILRVWIQGPAVVIGRTLQACEEVDCDEALRLGVPVVRRVSGGGAVYHDWGNINVSLFIPRRIPVDELYRRGTGLIIEALEILGVKAHVENRNDVVVSGVKVSGSAAALRASASLVHATLLVNADLGAMRRIIRPRMDRVLRGEVTPAKYNPGNLRDLAGISVREAVEALLQAAPLELERSPIPREALERARSYYRHRYSGSLWNPLGPVWYEEPGGLGF